MRESSIVRKIIAAVKAKYPLAYVRKLADRHTRGLPDILIVALCEVDFSGGEYASSDVCGILFVETKAAKGRPSKLQEVELASIHKNGGETLVARDAESVLAKLKQMGAIS